MRMAIEKRWIWDFEAFAQVAGETSRCCGEMKFMAERNGSINLVETLNLGSSWLTAQAVLVT